MALINWVLQENSSSKEKGKTTSSLRTQERRESLEEEPVAQTARMVPSSCSCTEGRRATVPPGAFSPSIHLNSSHFFYDGSQGKPPTPPSTLNGRISETKRAGVKVLVSSRAFTYYFVEVTLRHSFNLFSEYALGTSRNVW